MTTAQSYFVHLSNLLVGGTGLVYGWMRYFAEPEDEFAIVNHPLQPDLQHWHILTAPLLIFAIGMIWSPHVWKHYRRGTKGGRRTGITLGLTLFPMIFSGYALQVSESQSWTTWWMWLHLATSISWIFFGTLHPFLPRSKKVD